MPEISTLETARRFVEAYPDLQVVDLLLPDMNGIVRGKQIPIAHLEKIITKGLNYPGSSSLYNVKGQTIKAIAEGSQDGDPDLLCTPVPETLAPVPWAPRPTAQMMMSMYGPDGTPYFADPRHVLQTALKPLRDMGLTPVIAVELEFYLFDAETLPPKPARPPVHFPALTGAQCYGLEPLYDFHGFISEIESVCGQQNIPASSAVCEYGDGQFEVNLHHTNDPLEACDQAVLLKRAIKGVARRHGLLASFMAKPLSSQPGNGMHVHLSLYDDGGRNIFAGQGTKTPYTDELRHAIGGVCQLMPESMAIFAPNANSYRRFQPGNYVPLTANWGANHRGVAVRLPLAEAQDTRLEHRIAGADANPYLVVAALVAGLHHGLTAKIDPGAMVAEGEIVEECITLPVHWQTALDAFAASTVLPRYLGARYAQIFTACRRDEARQFNAEISDRDYDWYLRNV